MSAYAFEIYSASGTFLADLTGIATSRSIKAGRNEAEEIKFSVDAGALKRKATDSFTTVENLIGIGSNEVRVRRSDTYLVGGRIESCKPSAERSHEEVKDITARGFLNMFGDRLFEKVRTFTAVDKGTIAWTLINEFQTASSNVYVAPLPAAAVCNFGITQGSIATIGTGDRTYEVGKILKEALVQLSEVTTNPLDFWFEYNKVFNVATRQGSDKPLIEFIYPGNILAPSDFPMDASDIANRALTLGADDGAGGRLKSIDEDSGSQLNYKLRQTRQQFNAITDTNTLSEHGVATIAAQKDPLEIPRPTVDLNGDISIEDFWVGDRITLKNESSNLPPALNGLYRVERITLSIDDNGGETAKLELSI